MRSRFALGLVASVFAVDCAIPQARAFTPPLPPIPPITTIAESVPDTEVLAEREISFGKSANVVLPVAPTEAPAHRYAKMDRFECEAELVRRDVSFTRVEEARGVLAPVRLTAPLNGVSYHSAIRESERKSSPYEIFDCRLVLALHDFSRDLAAFDVREVVHFSAYRPPLKSVKTPHGFIGKRHEGGLAIDIGAFVRQDGTVINVEKEFRGVIGMKPCPTDPKVKLEKKTMSQRLRAFVCEEHDRGRFHVMLTPNFNWAHRNHFHFEVTSAHPSFYLR